jgi:hypothetical protein
MAGAPLVIFADIDQTRITVGADAIASVGDRDFLDPALGFVN